VDRAHYAVVCQIHRWLVETSEHLRQRTGVVSILMVVQTVCCDNVMNDCSQPRALPQMPKSEEMRSRRMLWSTAMVTMEGE